MPPSWDCYSGAAENRVGRVRSFVEEIPDFEVRDGNVHISVGEYDLAMPLRRFRLAMARAAKALASHDAAGEIVPLKRRRRIIAEH